MSINKKIREMTFVAIFVAVISVVSQIAIPTPTGVPITIQIFAIALAGYYLDLKRALLSILIYVLLGGIGVPVFSGFKGGFFVLIGPTGGFIWGFIIIVILCAIFSKKALAIPMGIIATIVCHAFGVLQYMIILKIDFFRSAVLVSLPYIIKDILLVIGAYYSCLKINRTINGKQRD